MRTLGNSITRTCLGGGAVALSVVLLTGCKTELGGDMGSPGASAPGGGDGDSGAHAPSGTFGVSPLDNPDGTKRGLAPLTSAADKKAARKLIDKVDTKGRGPKTGYERDEFGYAWKDGVDKVPLSRNGCDTRNDVLKRDGLKEKFRSGSDCILASLTLHDPYTGKTISWVKAKATSVQIDHVMPLSYDWQMGAAHWDKSKREQIANDPLNLLPVDGSTNGSKSDSGPASWLPPNKEIRCSYAVRVAQVSVKYDLPVTSADKKTMLAQCGG